MSDREKLDNLRVMLDTLIDTCKSEIAISDKLIENAKSNKAKNKEIKEQMFWAGKLEVAEYIRYIFL